MPGYETPLVRIVRHDERRRTYSQIAYPKQKSSPLADGRDRIVVALATLAANVNSISTYNTNLRMTGPTSAYR
jgi:hypothetical protein